MPICEKVVSAFNVKPKNGQPQPPKSIPSQLSQLKELIKKPQPLVRPIEATPSGINRRQSDIINKLAEPVRTSLQKVSTKPML